jgi:hypothetical protein
MFVFKTHKANRGVVNFYSAGVVNHDMIVGLALVLKRHFSLVRNFG